MQNRDLEEIFPKSALTQVTCEIRYPALMKFKDSIPEFQSGGVVPGPLGQPTLAVVHGGERVIPVGGTSNHTNYEGNQYNVTINDAMAAAMFMEQARQQNLARFDARM